MNDIFTEQSEMKLQIKRMESLIKDMTFKLKELTHQKSNRFQMSKIPL